MATRFDERIKTMRFQYYLHDSERGSLAEHLTWKFPEMDPALAEKADQQRPFYEVTLECELDEETGKVTLISASL
jgi:hypothetical protein